MTLVLTAWRATLRTIRPAPCRSSRRPSAVRNTGPSVPSPMARSIAPAVRGASGIATTLPPLWVIVRVRWPRSRPRCSMSAPVASEIRRPSRRAGRSAHARPRSRARRRRAGCRARCGPARRRETHSPLAAAARGPPGSDPEVLLRPRTGRTRRWCTAAE
jgi:hypothetical protein